MPLLAPLPRRALPRLPLQKGFGLFEVLLGIAAASVMSVAVYSLFFASDVGADVKSAQKNLGTLSSQLEHSFGATGGYKGLTLNQAISDGLLPRAYTRGGSVETEWGAGVDVRSLSIHRPDDGFVIQYAGVPTEACTQLASAMASNVYDLRISGSTVFSSTGIDPAAVGSQCNRSAGATMEFVYYSGLSTGQAVAALPSSGSPSTPSVAGTSTIQAGGPGPLPAALTAGAQASGSLAASPASSRSQEGLGAVGVSPAAPADGLATPVAPGVSQGLGGRWVASADACVHVTGPAGPQDTCPQQDAWKAWQDIPNLTGKPLCNQAAASVVMGVECVADLALDTRTDGCMLGQQAVVQSFQITRVPKGMETRYSLQQYICR